MYSISLSGDTSAPRAWPARVSRTFRTRPQSGGGGGSQRQPALDVRSLQRCFVLEIRRRNQEHLVHAIGGEDINGVAPVLRIFLELLPDVLIKHLEIDI